ncbi:hypothetical protein CHL74_08445 [Prevotella sp. 885]|nr:hypothetical protein CHL74_08445 [Prevotella sp. 885]
MANGLYESVALDTHPPNDIMSDAEASLCQQKEKHKKHKVADDIVRIRNFVFFWFFPLVGACCAQIKGFALGCREPVLVRPNVKPFI